MQRDKVFWLFMPDNVNLEISNSDNGRLNYPHAGLIENEKNAIVSLFKSKKIELKKKK